jgi:methionyl-tRNA formyltransferase
MRLNIDRVAVVSPLPTAGVASATPLSALQPGTVLKSTNRLLIATGDDPIEILDLQPAGKRAMATPDFLRGYPLRPGDRCGPA